MKTDNGSQREEQFFPGRAEGSFSRPPPDIDVVPAPTEEIHTVGDATDALLTEISNNLVPSNSFHRMRTEHVSSEEDFSPSDEEYNPNSDEDFIDCEFEKRRQIYIPESDMSSIDDLENWKIGHNGMTQLLNNTPSDIQPDLSPQISVKKSRKRTVNKLKWKCNLRKQGAITGKSYTSKKGKVVPEKKMKPACDCRLKCNERINDSIRQLIYQKYYAEEMTWDLKRQFIISRVSEVQTARSRRRDPDQPPKRAYTLNYTFLIDENVEKVCKKFFLNTLAISETVVRNAVKKSSQGFVHADRRGRHSPPNKTADIVKETVRKHIGKIPKYESHYSRNRTERHYLGSHLNIDKLYSLYLEFCAEEGIPKENMAKAWLYRHIFNTEFNLGFNPPANDTCDDCDTYVTKYKNATDETEKNNIKALHNKYLDESEIHVERI
uniref:SFRICE_000696 n=1 Tax=Spodoptera frugiperda TaxID=7108 RepID=A0A2H1V0H9_SPOFR